MQSKDSFFPRQVRIAIDQDASFTSSQAFDTGFYDFVTSFSLSYCMKGGGDFQAEEDPGHGGKGNRDEAR